MGDCRFSKQDRLLNAGDYRRVFQQVDAKASHKYFLLLGSNNDLPQHRLGLVIAKKHVRLAVQRNRVKRIAREFFRLCPESTSNLDVILLARPGMDQLENAALTDLLRQQWQKLTAS